MAAKRAQATRVCRLGIEEKWGEWCVLDPVEEQGDTEGSRRDTQAPMPADLSPSAPPLHLVEARAAKLPAKRPAMTHSPQPLKGRMDLSCEDMLQHLKPGPKEFADVKVIAYSCPEESGRLAADTDSLCHANFLSMSNAGEVKLHGQEFRCAEGAFWAGLLKPLFPEKAENFRSTDAEAAKILGENFRGTCGPLESHIRPVMKEVLEAVFSASDLAEGLLNTGESFILEHSFEPGMSRKDDWSDNADGSGKNLRGWLLMAIREDLRIKASRPATRWAPILQHFVDGDERPRDAAFRGRLVKAAHAVLMRELGSEVQENSGVASHTKRPAALQDPGRVAVAKPERPSATRSVAQDVPTTKVAATALQAPSEGSSQYQKPGVITIMMLDPRDALLKQVRLIAFYYPGEEEECDKLFGHAMFGNFFHCGEGIQLHGKTFRNAEAAFQALKFWDDVDDFTQVDGKGAFALKRSLEMRGARADPKYHGCGGNFQAMLQVLESKFSMESFQELLLNSGDAFLIEHNSVPGRDTIWSNNNLGDGKNWLGMQLMLLRDRLLQSYGRQATGWTKFIVDTCRICPITGIERSEYGTRLWQQAVMNATSAAEQALRAKLTTSLQASSSFVRTTPPMCMRCGLKPTFDGKLGYCSKTCRDAQAFVAKCCRQGCERPTWNGNHGEYCSRICQAQAAGAQSAAHSTPSHPISAGPHCWSGAAKALQPFSAAKASISSFMSQSQALDAPPVCRRHGCNKPTFDGRPGYCSRSCMRSVSMAPSRRS
mmetsp:Transcript_45766/g.83842  ORF Transcript_45766/g.83842 Transcript_45766/m.83842 type:complete len:770 (-) Transcript_45766:83-2392(-)